MPDPYPIGQIEGENAMRGLATLIRAFYDGLVDSGFSPAEALTLSAAYVSSLGANK